jgi:hypothetical protein
MRLVSCGDGSRRWGKKEGRWREDRRWGEVGGEVGKEGGEMGGGREVGREVGKEGGERGGGGRR